MTAFIAELKRRKVFHVAVAYGAVARLVAQLVSIVEEPLSLPAWFDTAFIVLLIAGFPLALVFAWAHELAPDGGGAAARTKAADKPETVNVSRRSRMRPSIRNA